MNSRLQQLRSDFLAAAGQMSQTLGYGRALGQVYAHVYLSPTPQTLDDLTSALGISKASASIHVRQLEQWGALRKVWVKGARKDFYEATESLGPAVRKALLDSIGRTLESADHLLNDAETLLARPNHAGTEAADQKFLEDRIGKLLAFRSRAQRVWESSILKLLLR